MSGSRDVCINHSVLCTHSGAPDGPHCGPQKYGGVMQKEHWRLHSCFCALPLCVQDAGTAGRVLDLVGGALGSDAPQCENSCDCSTNLGGEMSFGRAHITLWIHPRTPELGRTTQTTTDWADFTVRCPEFRFFVDNCCSHCVFGLRSLLTADTVILGSDGPRPLPHLFCFTHIISNRVAFRQISIPQRGTHQRIE